MIASPGLTLHHKVLLAFAFAGVVGLILCAVYLHRDHISHPAFTGILLIFTSLIGLVITAMSMAIAGVLKATRK